MEACVKCYRLVRNSEIAIEVIELTSQSSEMACHTRGIADIIIGTEVALECRLHERRLCGTGIPGRFRQPRSRACGEINANSGFHEGLSWMNTTQSTTVQTNH